jgi:hypothetical protein
MTEIALPDTLRTVGANAFFRCVSLKKTSPTPGTFALPDGMRSIGRAAFYGCREIRRLALPASLASLGDQAFALCLELEAVDIPAGVGSVPEAAFFGCEKLVRVRFAGNIASVGLDAFKGCTKLFDSDGFFDANGVVLSYDGPADVRIPASAYVITPGAFAGRDDIASVFAPSVPPDEFESRLRELALLSFCRDPEAFEATRADYERGARLDAARLLKMVIECGDVDVAAFLADEGLIADDDVMPALEMAQAARETEIVAILLNCSHSKSNRP